jgi:hypothetical protein
MARWEIMTSPKRAGGVGFTNTRIMNRCMLAKWLMKIEGGDETLCCKLLRNKYLRDNGIASYKRNNGSQFWKGLMAVRKDISRGMVYKIGNGKKARFWQDVWIGTCALRVAFPGIYEICNQQEWTVAKVMRNENLNLTFRRNFGATQTIEWSELRTLIDGMSLTQAPDNVKWIFEKSGEFSTATLYRELTFTRIINKWMMNILRAKLPLKIKIFLWQVCNDKVQSAEQLKKKLSWSFGVQIMRKHRNCRTHFSEMCISLIFMECV